MKNCRCKISDEIHLSICSRGKCDLWAVLVQCGREGGDSIRETVPHKMAELHELEAEGRDGMDQGGRHESHYKVCVCVNSQIQKLKGILK